jgi:hypothetical protein
MKTTQEFNQEDEYNNIRNKILERIQFAREQNDTESEDRLQTELNYIDNARITNA